MGIIFKKNVRPRIDNLESPPSPDEGYIYYVKFEYEDTLRPDYQYQACQNCGAEVPLSEPHIRVKVWRENAISMVQKFPVFCSRTCWSRWASNSE